MIYLAFALSAAATVGVGILRSREEASRSFRGLLLSNLFDFFLCVMVVSFAYSCLTFWARSFDNPLVSLQQLEHVEGKIDIATQYLRAAKLGPRESVALLLACFALTVLLGPLPAKGRAFGRWFATAQEWFAGFQKWAKRGVTLAALFGSVTFFGGTVPALHATIEARITALRNEWNAFEEQLERKIVEGASLQVAELALQDAPAGYAQTLDRTVSFDEDVRRIAGKQREEWSRYGFANQPLDANGQRVEEEVRRRAEVAKQATEEWRPAAERRGTQSTNEPPGHATQAEVEEARREVSSIEPRMTTAFGSPTARRLVSSLLGLLFDPSRSSTLAAAIEAFPALEPLIGVMTSAVGSKAGYEVAEAADHLARERFRDGNGRISGDDVARRLSAISSSIGNSMPVFWAPESAAQVAAAEKRVLGAALVVDYLRSSWNRRLARAIRDDNAELARKVRAKMAALAAETTPASAHRPLSRFQPADGFEAKRREDILRRLDTLDLRRSGGNDGSEIPAHFEIVLAEIDGIPDEREKRARLRETLAVLEAPKPAAERITLLDGIVIASMSLVARQAYVAAKPVTRPHAPSYRDATGGVYRPHTRAPYRPPYRPRVARR